MAPLRPMILAPSYTGADTPEEPFGGTAPGTVLRLPE